MTEPTLDAPASSTIDVNAQQAAAAPKPAASGIPEGYVPEARLTGALQTIEKLTLTNRALSEQITAANTRLGELQAQGTQKETEWTSKAGEQTNALKGVTTERDTLKQQVATLEANQAKFKMIGEMGHYNLLAIADQIPVDADPVKQKANIERMAAFATQLVNGREQELTAGETKPILNPDKAGDLPTTSAGWSKLIDGLPFGSPERQAAFDGMFAWSQTQKPVKA